MVGYYVNRNAQSNGDHEVHKERCAHLPAPSNLLYLGDYNACDPAVEEAKKHYPNSNGCYYCSRSCHAG